MSFLQRSAIQISGSQCTSGFSIFICAFIELEWQQRKELNNSRPWVYIYSKSFIVTWCSERFKGPVHLRILSLIWTLYSRWNCSFHQFRDDLWTKKKKFKGLSNYKNYLFFPCEGYETVLCFVVCNSIPKFDFFVFLKSI